MTTLQIALLCLAIPATLYQIIQISHTSAVVSKFGRVRLTRGWYVAMGVAMSVQIAFVLAMTGVL